MNAERLTTKSREVIKAAVDIAAGRGHATVEPWHLLLALLDTGGATATAPLRAGGAHPARPRRRAPPAGGELPPPAGRRVAVRAVENLPSARGSSVAEPSIAREFANAINAAEQIARPLGD